MKCNACVCNWPLLCSALASAVALPSTLALVLALALAFCSVWSPLYLQLKCFSPFRGCNFIFLRGGSKIKPRATKIRPRSLENKAWRVQNKGQEASKSSLEALKSTLKSLLGRSWAPLGANLEKSQKELKKLSPTWEAKWSQKSIKIDVKKQHVFRYAFLSIFRDFGSIFGSKFRRFLIDFWIQGENVDFVKFSVLPR